ncbi:MAG: cysteine--tRNA ligase [Minisyncoccota bacterium]
MYLYNTLTKNKEEFIPLHPGKVGMYSCGPTVYNYIHIGNIRAFVFADTVRRTLEDVGYEVRLIKNITDVGHMTADDIAQGDGGEDKVAKKAREEHKTPEEIALFFEDYFHRTEEKMNILPAHYFPRATAHIPQMIKLITELIAKGHAYTVNGNVFLDVTTFPDYGRLSGNTLKKLKVGARLEEHPDKRHPWDFALWLKAPVSHLMHWPSPWSEGYPGWHIECSAMSMEYLGTTLDIHTGGEDNIFPHHEAEIVQSEGVTEQPFTHYFLHSRHMLADGIKMSKSKGNFYTLENILERGFTAMDFRLTLLGSHYRSQMNFTWESIEQGKKNKETLLRTYERISLNAVNDPNGFDGTVFLERIRSAIRDDFNTPEALAIALELARHSNVLMDTQTLIQTTALQSIFEKIFFLLGLVTDFAEVIPADIEALAQERHKAREDKNFQESDRVRSLLETRGYYIEDITDGYRVRKI